MPHLTTRDGARLHYLDVGRRAGPACVLLHGFGMHGALWLPVIAPLLVKQRFILPDLRGFGGSHGLRITTSNLIHQHADDVADLIEALGLEQVRLAGLSMGACTAMDYHARYGFGRVHSYLHIDQAPRILNGDDWSHGVLGPVQAERLADWGDLLQRLEVYRDLPFERLPGHLRQRFWGLLAEFLGFAFSQRGWRRAARLTRHDLLAKRLVPTTNWTVYLDSLRSYLRDGFDWRDSLKQMTQPMTVMIGGRSAMYPAEGQRLLGDLVPHARLIEFPKSGHVIPYEAPLRFVAEFDRFLRAA
ncbi:alpha/beta hydrolase [Nevskia sp.]|uniref:alpha/beta fold hydrolase n=1 Tax=Nevskia sp. TaxID=1929292 RepID=UPI0025E72ECB|nr:alpha/beta hydrolase [Nevskia sp.]